MPRKTKSNQINTLKGKISFHGKHLPNSFHNNRCDSTSNSSVNSTEIVSLSSSSSSLEPIFISKEDPPINEMISQFTESHCKYPGEQIYIPYEDVPTEKAELRRAFIEGMAWACASNDNIKSGLNVTAAAVESCEDGKSVVWLAANRGISGEVLAHAKQVINMIKRFAVDSSERRLDDNGVAPHAHGLDRESWSAYEQTSERNVMLLVKKLIKLKGKHMDDRREALYMSTDGLIKSLEEKLPETNSAVNIQDIIYWLQTIKETVLSMTTDKLVKYLFHCKYDETYTDLHKRFQTKDLGHLESFSFHLYDFGKSLLVAQTLQSAAKCLDFLKQDVSVKAYGTGRHMNRSIHARLKPAVHAEVYLVELFCRSEKQLLEKDDFVGCSKPACFCCHLYIEKVVNPLRKRSFKVRQAHDKVYRWLFPELHLLETLPNMSHLDSWYLSKSYEIFNKIFNSVQEKVENRQIANQSYKDDPIGLPYSRFDENSKFLTVKKQNSR